MFNDILNQLAAMQANAGKCAPIFCGVKSAKADDPLELTLYGEVGNSSDMLDAQSVVRLLRGNKQRDVVARINSGGGLAFDGIAISNAFREHSGNVTTVIEGIAGSAASLIAIGGKRVLIHENALFFMHRASLGVYGNIDALDEAKGWLDRIDESIAKMYRAKSNRGLDRIHEMMKGRGDGSVLSAKEAMENRFVDDIIPLKALRPVQSEIDKLPTAQRDEVGRRLAPAGFMEAMRKASRKSDGINPAA